MVLRSPRAPALHPTPLFVQPETDRPKRVPIAPPADPLPGPFSFRIWYRLARRKPNRFSPLNWFKLYATEIRNYWRLWKPLIVTPTWETPKFFFRFTRSRWLTPRKFRIALFFPVLYFWWCYFRGFPKFFPALSFNENVQFFIKYLFKTYPVILNEWVPQFFSILYRELSDYGLVYGVIYGFGRFHVYFHTFSFLTLLASFLFFFWGSYEILQRRNIELQPYFWKATPTEMVNNYPLYWFFPAWGRIQEMVHYKIMRKVQDNETEIFEELMWDEDKVARNTAYAELYPPIVYPIAWLLWFPFRMLLFFPLFFISLPFLFVWWLDYLYAKQHKTLFTPLGCLRRLHRDFFWLLSFPFDIVCGYFYPYYRRELTEKGIPYLKALPHKMEMDWVAYMLAEEDQDMHEELEGVLEESPGGWCYNWRIDFFFIWSLLNWRWRKLRPTIPKPSYGDTRFRHFHFRLYKFLKPIRRVYQHALILYGRTYTRFRFKSESAWSTFSQFMVKVYERALQFSREVGLTAKVAPLFYRLVDYLIERSTKAPLSPISLLVRSRVLVPWLLSRKNFVRFSRVLYQRGVFHYDKLALHFGWSRLSAISSPIYRRAEQAVDVWYNQIYPPISVSLYWFSWLAFPAFILFFLTPFPSAIINVFPAEDLLYSRALLFSIFIPLLFFSFPPLRRWAWWDLRFYCFASSLAFAYSLEVAVELKYTWINHEIVYELLGHFFFIDLPWMFVLFAAPFIQFEQLLLFYLFPPSFFEWVVPSLYAASSICSDLWFNLYVPSPLYRFIVLPILSVCSYIPFFDRTVYLLDLWYYYELRPYLAAFSPQFEWFKHTLTWSIPVTLGAIDVLQQHIYIPEWIQVACTTENFPFLLEGKPYKPFRPKHFMLMDWRSFPPFNLPPFPLPPWR